MAVASALAAGLALSGQTALGASRSSGWLSSQTLGPGAYFNAESHHVLAGNAAGAEAVVWVSSRGIQLARADPGRAFGPALLISRRTPSGTPFVAIDGHGDVLVAWQYSDGSVEIPDIGVYGFETICCDHVVAATVGAGKRRVHTRALTSASVSAEVESIGISQSGSVAAVAYRSTPKALIVSKRSRYVAGSELMMRTAAHGRRFSAPHALAANAELRVPFGASVGGLRALYRTTRADGPSKEPTTSLGEVAVTDTGRFRTRTIGAIKGLRSIEGGFDQDGELAALVEENVGLGIVHDFGVQTAGGALRLKQAALERSRLGPEGGIELSAIFTSPTLSVSTRGTFLAEWGTGPPLRSIYKLAVGHLPSGRLSDPVEAPLPAASSDIRVAVNGDGQAVITAVDGLDETRAEVLGMFRTASGRLTAPVDLGEVGNTNSLGEAALTVSASGEGTAVWEADPGDRTTLVARRFRVPG